MVCVLFRIRNVYKNYQTQNSVVEALKGVNLDLPDKGFVSLVGKSGSGKTTLLKLIGGLEKATSGEIFYDSKNICLFDESECCNYRRNVVSYLFQDNNLIDILNVEENIDLVFDKPDLEKINHSLEVVGLGGYNKRFTNELSGGQIQRVAIARCIAKECKILLCDEPTSSLDEENSENVFCILKELSKSILVVVSSHNEELVEKYSDYIIRISDGKVEPLFFESNEESLPYRKDDIPIKKIFKIGIRHLKRKRNKLMLTSLLCFLSSVFLSTLLSTFSYNEKNLGVREYINSNDNYIVLRRSDGQKVTKETTSIINSDFDTTFLTAYHIDARAENLKMGEYGQNTLTAFDCLTVSNIANYSKYFFDKHNFNLLVGSFPNKQEEVLITDYTYQIFNKYGYYDPLTNEISEIKTYEDLLDKSLCFKTFFNSKLVISGIVDTRFDYTKYNKFKLISSKERPTNNKDRYMYTFDYISIMKNSIHSSIFLYDFESFFKENNTDDYHKIEPNVMIDAAVNKKVLCNIVSNREYIIDHYAFEKAKATTDYLIPIRNVLLIFGFVLFISSFLTQLNYLKLSVNGSSGEIRLLNAIGFKRKDVGFIFGFELIFISILSSILSIFTAIGFVAATNYCFDKYLAVYTGVIFFQLYLPIAIILLNVLVSFVSLIITFKIKHLLN